MFGLGMNIAYGGITVDILGGMRASLLVAIATRLLVGIGWFGMFRQAGKNPYLAFVPFAGPYTAFRMVWDDISLAAIFASSTIVAFTAAVGVDHPIVNAFSIVNFIMWWFMAILTGLQFQVGMLLTFLYGGMPWFGSLILGYWPNTQYKGPWSTDPEADQNLTKQQLKKKRKKEAKAAKRKA